MDRIIRIYGPIVLIIIGAVLFGFVFSYASEQTFPEEESISPAQAEEELLSLVEDWDSAFGIIDPWKKPYPIFAPCMTDEGYLLEHKEEDISIWVGCNFGPLAYRKGFFGWLTIPNIQEGFNSLDEGLVFHVIRQDAYTWQYRLILSHHTWNVTQVKRPKGAR